MWTWNPPVAQRYTGIPTWTKPSRVPIHRALEDTRAIWTKWGGEVSGPHEACCNWHGCILRLRRFPKSLRCWMLKCIIAGKHVGKWLWVNTAQEASKIGDLDIIRAWIWHSYRTPTHSTWFTTTVMEGPLKHNHPMKHFGSHSSLCLSFTPICVSTLSIVSWASARQIWSYGLINCAGACQKSIETLNLPFWNLICICWKFEVSILSIHSVYWLGQHMTSLYINYKSNGWVVGA